MKRYLTVLLTLCCAVFKTSAQFQGGIEMSNHSGVMGVTINPSFSNYLTNGTDLMLGGINFSILNNGFYMGPKPITSLIKPEIINSFSNSGKDNNESINQTFDRVFSLRRDLKKNNYAFANTVIYGPSFLINYKKHSFGIITSFKAASTTINMPKEMAIFLLKGPSAIELQGKTMKMQGVKSNTLVYSDIAFNYSYQIAETYSSVQRLGFTAHFLIPNNSMVFEDRNNSKWTYIGDSTIQMTNSDFVYNYSAVKSSQIGELMGSKGSGFAFDFGYSYTKKNKQRKTRITTCPNIRFLGKVREYQSYKYRIGASIMDIGFVNLTKNTMANTYEGVNATSRKLDEAFFNGVFALNRKLYYDLNTPGTKRTEEHSYTQYTATRINLQFDYNINNSWFISFTGSHRIPMPNTISLTSANIMSITPRLERPNVDLMFPVSLIEYQYPVLGFCARIGPVFIGSNQILEMVGLRKIKGEDIYFGLKFNFSNFRGVRR